MTNEEALTIVNDVIERAKIIPAAEVYSLWETIREALEKQIAKKPLIITESGYYPDYELDWWYECPTCGNKDIDYPDHHCICGQALTWEEENDQ